MSLDQHTLAGPLSAAPPRAPWSVRLRVRLHAEALDAALASGALPGERPELALRARQLTSGSGRERLARRLDGLVDQARRPGGMSAAIAPPAAAVLAAAADLEALATDLRAPGPIQVQGAARTARMFSDGRLSGRTAGELRHCARWASAML